MRLCSALLALLLAPFALAAGPTNVVIFLSDDVGYGEYGFQGSTDIPTPNIDSIAKNGIRFTQGYVSGPYCSPTRAGLMTGKYQTRFGHEFNGAGPEFGLPVNEKTIADRFKELGYVTACVGKWHLGVQPQFQAVKRGFDSFYGTLGNTPYFNPPNFMDSRVSNDRQPVQDDNFYSTDAYASRVVEFIEGNKAKPFFLYVPFNAQHAPLQATKKYLERFPNIADEKRRTFAAMMSAMDDAVGRVLTKLREIGKEEDTLIVFFSDNGGPTEQTTSKNGPLRGRKATTLEGGVRVPFCVQWKAKYPAGKVYDKPVIQLDLLPTALTACGGKVDPAWKLDGVDLTPYLTGQNAGTPHETLYWRFGQQWAIRHGDWKLVAATPDNLEQKLFHLSEDIGEAKDQTAANPAKVKELKELWNKWNGEQMAPRWPAQSAANPKAKAKAKNKVDPLNEDDD